MVFLGLAVSPRTGGKGEDEKRRDRGAAESEARLERLYDAICVT
jgi:hypothetical protein